MHAILQCRKKYSSERQTLAEHANRFELEYSVTLYMILQKKSLESNVSLTEVLVFIMHEKIWKGFNQYGGDREGECLASLR